MTGVQTCALPISGLVTAARAAAPDLDATRIVLRPKAVDAAEFEVVRQGESFLVRGVKPGRWVRQTDFSNDEAVGYLADRLARLGVEDALLAAGAGAGDEILIGDGTYSVVFDWEPTMKAGAELLHGRRGTDLRLDGR